MNILTKVIRENVIINGKYIVLNSIIKGGNTAIFPFHNNNVILYRCIVFIYSICNSGKGI